MLTKISLTNFKQFEEKTDIPVSLFNLFTGSNNSGKSTVLQPLLLLRQSIDQNIHTNEILLNGNYINIGSFTEIKNEKTSQNDSIVFTFSFTNQKSESNVVEYLLQQNQDSSLCTIKNLTHIEGVSYENQFLDFSFENIHVLLADRIGGQDIYKKRHLSRFPNVGSRGEFFVNILNVKKSELVHESLCLGDNAHNLLSQTEAWIGEIFKPVQLNIIEPHRFLEFLELRIGKLSPTNMGFGFNSLLPIIVSGLIAKPGDKLIIECPERGLHPRTQSKLTEFLIAVASTGVQIFIDSQSDHIFNALRIAVLKKSITKENTNVLYFSNHSVEKIEINDSGSVNYWPNGFFDQISNDLSALLGL